MVVAVLVLAVIAVNKRNKGRLVKIRRRN